MVRTFDKLCILKKFKTYYNIIVNFRLYKTCFDVFQINLFKTIKNKITAHTAVV